MVRSKKIAGLALATGLAIGGLTASTAGAGVRFVVDLRRFRRGDHGQREAGRRRDVHAPVPVRRLERDAVPLQPRLRHAGEQQPGPGRRRPGHRWLATVTRSPVPPTPRPAGRSRRRCPTDRHAGTFEQPYRQPRRTVAWGHSLGGIITAGLIQRYPKRFDAALPMCGVLSGGVATWNTALDAEFAFQQLVDPSVQVVNITNPTGNLPAPRPPRPPRSRPRRAGPGWPWPPRSVTRRAGSPRCPRTRRRRLAARKPTSSCGNPGDFPFIFAFRAELEARAGGNPSWNTGVNYFARAGQVSGPQRSVALYHAAGLSLTGDLQKLNQARGSAPARRAVKYLAEHRLQRPSTVPVLTMHTTGDGLVVPENEQAYRSVVDRAGAAAAAPDLRAPGRALRVHPGRDHRRGPG